MSNTTVAEIVTFRLNDGADPAAFAKAAAGLEPLLRASQDALSRCLSCDADGLWTDHITWTSMETAKAMADNIMADPLAGPMMALIDPASVTMRHAPILYQME